MNKITLFANGIADFELTYDVSQEGTDIRIPVKKEHLSDIINMSVFGRTEKDKIKIVERPNFPQQVSNPAFSYEKDDVNTLFTATAGAMVKLTLCDDDKNKEVAGVIVGLHYDDVDTGRYKLSDPFITLYSDGELHRVALREVIKFQFTCSRVNEAIKRKLLESQSTIIPESSSIHLKVKSESGPAKAVVRFTMPVAAWAMEYQIHMVKNVWQIAGAAIVHNNTDQPWTDCELRCVSGIPFTEKTNIAEHQEPVRNVVPILPDNVIGGTEVKRFKRFASDECVGDVNYAHLPTFDKHSDPVAAAVEVGDFSIFSPRELVSVPAKSSAVIEVIGGGDMLGAELAQCEQVLYYNRKNPFGGRPQQAIRFTNHFPFSLQRGPCNIYYDGLFQGTAILPLTKPGQQQFLLHGLDTGVEITRSGGKVKKTFTKLKVHKGLICVTMSSTAITTYTIRSVKDKTCSIVVDHDRVLTESVIGPDKGEKTANGMRFVKVVPAKDTCEFNVTEVHNDYSEIQFTDLGWIRDNVINVEHKSLKSFTGLGRVIDLGGQIDAVTNDIVALDKQRRQLEVHQKEIRENIKVSGESQHTVSWREQLKNNDNEIVDISKSKIPELERNLTSLKKEFLEACQKVSAAWES